MVWRAHAEAHNQVLSWLNMGATPKLELLYRASNDGFEGRDFHSRCDNKSTTVTMIKCTDSYVFGGFTSTSWASTSAYVACANAFIFSIHRPGGVSPVKLAPRAMETEHAIFDWPTCGPRFGLVDIDMQSTSNIYAKNSTNLNSYVLPPGYPPVDASAFFTGTSKFRAGEVEVFRVLA